MFEAALDQPLSGLLLCGITLLIISPRHFRGPPQTPSAHKEELELARVIWIIIISAFSASWVPEKVREQHEDRLISVLVLASIWQQTIGKGLGPGHSSMAQDSSHRQKHDNTQRQLEPRWVSEAPRRPARLNDCTAACAAAGCPRKGDVQE